ncbi:hypothetical protein MAPG_10717 [Magnaporthiopsis poae ATCC 64411]|uniref:Uncharacterized protein n=1 Tax=Magnaporthiopsis poae (strain ATCC 64411 / 73-15) TaxID=644358 RepID=A0A0C4EDC2_MAGP6|nr:hypothetical protein MAPG_10717 [Magnaporthiopsis poae ATCC 64411]
MGAGLISARRADLVPSHEASGKKQKVVKTSLATRVITANLVPPPDTIPHGDGGSVSSDCFVGGGHRRRRKRGLPARTAVASGWVWAA